VFPVRYEDLVEDMEQVTRRVLAYLGVPLPYDVVVRARTAKARDPVTEGWLARYRWLRGPATAQGVTASRGRGAWRGGPGQGHRRSEEGVRYA
jgi:hypothetical protein